MAQRTLQKRGQETVRAIGQEEELQSAMFQARPRQGLQSSVHRRCSACNRSVNGLIDRQGREQRLSYL